eukprot:CAMPEP_0176006266 /NCGR_PEP_ID=MMETSP0120_2-20121206/2633_1 /TAXON_ID=160619 /ORGANISM="Kryptoperidinium foliaceum, Strain CCMP 1326" /LENGTH=464 /DNA_ID=CAMNT_0017338999 /DNA_START=59 /DNA_END=1452 /DNA_ORIENTATION=-
MIVIFWQFGLGMAAMLLRFFESKTFAEWCHRCHKFARKGLLCCRNFWCCPCDTSRRVYTTVQRSLTGSQLQLDGTPPARQTMVNRPSRAADDEHPTAGSVAFWRWAAELAIRTLWPRWYWFLLAGQVGFMVREYMVVTMLNGWYIDVVVAHIATWLVIALTAKQVWAFSYVRHKALKAVDQILDILLLPMNYGFICTLCVRILRLQDVEQNRSMAMALLHSADIWESWALWSVLQLFTRIVDHDSQEEARRAQEFTENLRQKGRVSAVTATASDDAEHAASLLEAALSVPPSLMQRAYSDPTCAGTGHPLSADGKEAWRMADAIATIHASEHSEVEPVPDSEVAWLQHIQPAMVLQLDGLSDLGRSEHEADWAERRAKELLARAWNSAIPKVLGSRAALLELPHASAEEASARLGSRTWEQPCRAWHSEEPDSLPKELLPSSTSLGTALPSATALAGRREERVF